MIKLTKIYTKSGDQGLTSLGNQQRVYKDDLRIQALGSIDEANSIIGICRLYVPTALQKLLSALQHDLFDCGADLCVPEKTSQKSPLRITEKHIIRIEQYIDHYNKSLSTLTSFVLPGGSQPSAYLHLARTIIRRAERDVVSLLKTDSHTTHQHVLIFLNRLSDLLFVLARHTNNNGQDDVLWVPGKSLVEYS